ncbi:hypothetical protein [Streptomyces sp. enrichment culture]
MNVVFSPSGVVTEVRLPAASYPYSVTLPRGVVTVAMAPSEVYV